MRYETNKLSRTYATLLESLNRHRGKGQQKVNVEHVHVHSGGQAIAGSIDAGGGAAPKPKDQPHALAYAPGQTVPSTDPARDRVPIARFRATFRFIELNEAVTVFAAYEQRAGLLRGIVRVTLSRLLGWPYDGSDEARQHAVTQLPLIAFRART